jgi:hypothetical protein
MTAKIKTEIAINASPAKVWEILTDFEDYPNWNPFIKSVTGPVRAGNSVTIRVEPPEASGMTFKPMILAFEPRRELRWLGKLLFTGLFDGEHKFELLDAGNGTSRFIQSEEFKGILVPLFKKQLNNNTKRGFEAMNKKLKELAEQG